MLEIIKDDLENIKAVLEFYIVDNQGHLDDKGEYIWINDLEISKSYRNNGLIKEFIKKIINKVPYAKFGYFNREKYNGRVKMYSKYKWLEFANK